MPHLEFLQLTEVEEWEQGGICSTSFPSAPLSPSLSPSPLRVIKLEKDTAFERIRVSTVTTDRERSQIIEKWFA